MKRFFSLLCAAAMTAFTSCEKDAEELDNLSGVQPGRYALTATIAEGSATRAYLDEAEDGKTYAFWKEGDKIKVITGLTYDAQPLTTEYTLSSGGGREGVFTGNEAPGYVTFSGCETFLGSGNWNENIVSDWYAAIYPASTAFYQSDNDTSSAFVYLGGTIPAEQHYTEDSFDPQAMPMLALWKDETSEGEPTENIIFRPMASVVCLQLYADTETTLSEIVFNASPIDIGTSQSYFQNKTGVAGKVWWGGKQELWDKYDDASADFLLRDEDFTFQPVLNTSQAKENFITLKGPIVLSTDVQNPTKVFLVVNCAAYNDGFNVVMSDTQGRKMTMSPKNIMSDEQKTEFFYTPCAALTPGDILRMPPLKFQSQTTGENAIEEIEISCTYPYARIEKSDETVEGKPLWTITYNSIDLENVDVNVTVTDAVAGVKWKDTELLGSTTVNNYGWTNFQILESEESQTNSTILLQSGGQIADGQYALWLKPSHYYDEELAHFDDLMLSDPNWKGDKARSGRLTLVSLDGETVLGYIDFEQVGRTDQYGFAYESVSSNSEGLIASFEPAVESGGWMHNSVTAVFTEPVAEGSKEYTMTIKVNANNPNQQEGLYLSDTEFKDEYQMLKDGSGADTGIEVKYRNGSDQNTIEIVFRVSPIENALTLSKDLLDMSGNVSASFVISVPSANAINGIYIEGNQVGELSHTGTSIGTVDKWNDNSEYLYSYEFYTAWELKLSTSYAGGATINLNAAGVENGNKESLEMEPGSYTTGEAEDPNVPGQPVEIKIPLKTQTYSSVTFKSDVDWITTSDSFAGLMDPLEADSHQIVVQSNTTGVERSAVLRVCSKAGMPLGTLTIVQAGN